MVDPIVQRMVWGRKKEPPFVWVDDFYGEHHQLERAKYVDGIRADGGSCMERICVMPTRQIEPGATWHLAHDHLNGGATNYLGPAHPECNKHEKRMRDETSDRALTNRREIAARELRQEQIESGWVEGSDGNLQPAEGWHSYNERFSKQHEKRLRSDPRWERVGQIFFLTFLFPGPLLGCLVWWIVYTVMHS